MKSWLFLLLTLPGCFNVGPLKVHYHEYDEAAYRLVWTTAYKAPLDLVVPRVVWHDEDIRCIPEVPQACASGAYAIDGTDTVHMIWEWRYGYSPLAHEFYHALLFKLLGDANADHSWPGWAIEVPRAQAMLLDWEAPFYQ